jgi:hypothetical protein
MTLTMEEHDAGELEGQGGDRDGRLASMLARWLGSREGILRRDGEP